MAKATPPKVSYRATRMFTTSGRDYDANDLIESGGDVPDSDLAILKQRGFLVEVAPASAPQGSASDSSEVEALKARVAELESKLKTAEQHDAADDDFSEIDPAGMEAEPPPAVPRRGPGRPRKEI